MKRIFAFSHSKFITQMVELALKGEVDLEIFTYNDLASALEQLPGLSPHSALIDLEGAQDGAQALELGLRGAKLVLWAGGPCPQGPAFIATARPLRPLEIKKLLLSV